MNNFLRVFMRQLKSNPFRVWLTVTGLTLGYLVVFVTGLMLHHELGYESMHHKAERIFRITMHNHADQYDMHWARTDRDYINRLSEELPGVRDLIRFQNYYPRTIRVGENSFSVEHAYTTDSDVFKVFDFPLIAGDPENALNRAGSAVLTRETAMRIFGTTDVLGKDIRILEGKEEVWYEVTGLMENLPGNTHLPVNILTSFPSEESRTGWAYTYLLLDSPDYAEKVTEQLPGLVRKYGGEETPDQISFPLQPIKSIHLHSDLAREIKLNGSWEYIWVFLLTGTLILILSQANFVNLLLTEVVQRRKSVAVHKIMGVANSHLMARMFTETLLLQGVSALLAVCFCFIFQVSLESLMPLSDPGPVHMAGLTGVVVLSSLICTVYPFRVLISTRAASALHQQGTSITGNRTSSLRNAIAGLQLVLSIAIVSAVFILQGQFRFLIAESRAAHGDQVLAIREIPESLRSSQQALKTELLDGPGVSSASSVMEIPSREIRDAGPVTIEGAEVPEEERPVADIQVTDKFYFKTNGYVLAGGRTFSETPVYPDETDLMEHLSSAPREYIINEEAMRMLGFREPAEVIGRRIRWEIGGIVLQYGPVVGVVENHYQETLRNRIDPVVIIQEPVWTRNILLRVDPQATEEALSHAEEVWRKFAPDHPLQMEFLDDMYARQYAREQAQLEILRILCFVVVLISFGGLLSLFYNLIKMREKELAVRKVLGAGIRSLALLLGRPLMVIMLSGLLISVPLTWYLLRRWLDQFAYRIAISLDYFIVAAIVATLVIFLSSAWMLVRLDRKDIAELLRSE